MPPLPPATPGSWTRPATVAVTCTIGSVLPAFLTGALAVQIGDDLGFSAARLGGAVSAFFVGAALSSALLGRVVERVGPAAMLRTATVASATLMLAIAGLARSYGALVGFLLVGGVANALTQPAANLLLARTVPSGRQGIAFAVKQSGMPAGTMLGGAAVPLVALTVGWRWAFVLGAALAIGAGLAVPRRIGDAAPREPAPVVAGAGADAVPAPAAPRARPGRPEPFGPLVILAVAIAFGAASAGAVVAFLVAGGVAAGLSPAAAGWTLTLGSALGIVMRLRHGVLADRRGQRHLPVVALMLAGGSVAYALYALGQPWVYVLATPLAFGAGWAWPGLFNLAVVRNYPAAPGAATGVTQTGTYAGAMAGPLAFGAIVSVSSFAVAWLAAAGASGIAAVITIGARRRLVRARVATRPGEPA